MIYSFTLAQFIFVLSIVANAAIAVFVYVNGNRHATNRLFLALSLAVSLWLTAMLATSIPALTPWYLQLARATLLFATPMNVLFFLFAATVPDARFGLRRPQLYAVLAVAAAVMALSVTPLTFSGIQTYNGSPQPIIGPGMAVFGSLQALLNIGVIVLLFVKLRRARDERHLQLSLVLLGILLMFGMITGTIFVPVLLLGDTTFVAFAPLYVLLFTGLTAYAIFKRQFLNVKVVAAEVFSAVLVFVNAVQLFLSVSPIDFMLRLATFLAVGFFAILFIRSIHAEVLRREELRVLAAELAEANKHLRFLDETKTEFISIVSHQLRTPASVIKGYLSLMMEGAYGRIDDTLRDKMEQMFGMNERLVHMINNLLNISRIEKNRVEFICTLFDLETLCSQVAEEMQFKSKEKKIVLSFARPAPGFPKAYADPDKVREVLINLIDNAIKYSLQGRVELGLRLDEAKRQAVVTITDTGIGMSEEEAKRVFEKFYRARNPSSNRETGTGLGLFICAKFLHGMGGKIWIERTEPNVGTTFAVSLPLSPVECAPEPELKPPEPDQAALSA